MNHKSKIALIKTDVHVGVRCAQNHGPWPHPTNVSYGPSMRSFVKVLLGITWNRLLNPIFYRQEKWSLKDVCLRSCWYVSRRTKTRTPSPNPHWYIHPLSFYYIPNVVQALFKAVGVQQGSRQADLCHEGALTVKILPLHFILMAGALLLPTLPPLPHTQSEYPRQPPLHSVQFVHGFPKDWTLALYSRLFTYLVILGWPFLGRVANYHLFFYLWFSFGTMCIIQPWREKLFHRNHSRGWKGHSDPWDFKM